MAQNQHEDEGQVALPKSLSLRIYSQADYEDLERQVAEGGYGTFQELFEHRIFGVRRAPRKRGPKPKHEVHPDQMREDFPTSA